MKQPSLDRLREILASARTIAVVGYSKNPARPSHWIAEYLHGRGYRVIPVNPGIESALGERCYRRLSEVPDAIDVVNVFRSPEHVPEVVEDAIAKKSPVVWLQEGAENWEAAARAEEAGLEAIVGRCIFRDHASLIGGR